MSDAELIRAIFVYDPDTGQFSLRDSHKPKRKRASHIKQGGRRYLKLRTRYVISSRCAWLYMYGEWPTNEVDHIDGDKMNDRIKNLRDVSRQVNAENKHHAQSNSKTGLLGVSPWHGKYRATILCGRKQTYLGLFASAQEAHEVYLAAKRRLHPGFVPKETA